MTHIQHWTDLAQTVQRRSCGQFLFIKFKSTIITWYWFFSTDMEIINKTLSCNRLCFIVLNVLWKETFLRKAWEIIEIGMSLFARQGNKLIDGLLPTPGEKIPEVRHSLISVQLLSTGFEWSWPTHKRLSAWPVHIFPERKSRTI